MGASSTDPIWAVAFFQFDKSMGGHIGKIPVQRHQFRKVQATVERRYARRFHPARNRVMKIIDMKMNDVEVPFPPEDLFHHHYVCRQGSQLGSSRSELLGRDQMSRS